MGEHDLISFYADRTEFFPQDDELLASVFFKSHTTGNYFSLTRQLYGEQSRKIEIERDEQSWSSSQGIAQCEVSPKTFTLKVTPDSARELEAEQWKISYDISEKEFELLVSALMNILDGTGTQFIKRD